MCAYRRGRKRQLGGEVNQGLPTRGRRSPFPTLFVGYGGLIHAPFDFIVSAMLTLVAMSLHADITFVGQLVTTDHATSPSPSVVPGSGTTCDQSTEVDGEDG